MYYFYPFYYGCYTPPVNENMNYRNNGVDDKNKIYAPMEEAFTKGNVLPSQYVGYRDYIPLSPRPKSEQEKLLYKLMMIDGTMHDLVLLLDIFPRDGSAIAYFEALKKQHQETYSKYLQTYGQLYVGDSEAKDGTFSWDLTTSPYAG